MHDAKTSRRATPAPARAAALATALAAAAAVPAAADGGEQLWRFYADFSVTAVAAVPDLSGNGGMDALVGSADDTLYLVEGRGPGRGAPLWQSAFRSTLSAVAALPDITGDGKPDALGGDELGFIQAVNGATGASHWRYLTFGTVLSAAAVPDVNGDGVPDVVVGSENDTLYCFSGKKPASGNLADTLWTFGAPPRRGRGPNDPPDPPRKAAAQGPGGGGPKAGVSGVNSVTPILKGGALHGVAAGVSNDTVYCFPPRGGTPLWKSAVPGDAWQVAAFPDQDGDGIEEILVACGADAGFLLKGSNGAALWSHPVSMGAVSVAAAGDMTGDGKADALIGAGDGRLHCVPGNATGSAAAAAWTYDFGDTSTLHSLAPLGDADGDGRADCAVGTSHDLAAVISGKGTRLWVANLGGTVFGVANLGDLDGNGSDDILAGSEAGFAAAFQGYGATATRVRGPGASSGRGATAGAARPATLRLTDGAGFRFGAGPQGGGPGSRDLGGRLLPDDGVPAPGRRIP